MTVAPGSTWSTRKARSDSVDASRRIAIRHRPNPFGSRRSTATPTRDTFGAVTPVSRGEDGGDDSQARQSHPNHLAEATLSSHRLRMGPARRGGTHPSSWYSSGSNPPNAGAQGPDWTLTSAAP